MTRGRELCLLPRRRYRADWPALIPGWIIGLGAFRAAADGLLDDEDMVQALWVAGGGG